MPPSLSSRVPLLPTLAERKIPNDYNPSYNPHLGVREGEKGILVKKPMKRGHVSVLSVCCGLSVCAQHTAGVLSGPK